MNINEKIAQIREKICGGDNKLFAQKLGVSEQYASNICKIGKNVGDKQKQHILDVFPDINRAWFLADDGEMLKSSTPQARKKIPVYGSQSIGGYNDSVANLDADNKITEEIDAGDWFPEATAAIHHYGDSMVEYPSGSILALKRVNDRRLIINGRNYVIETTEFRITKQLQYDGGDFIMAYSSNTETYPDGRQIHSPIRIPVETVRHIDLVLGCVTKEYSNGAVIIRNKTK